MKIQKGFFLLSFFFILGFSKIHAVLDKTSDDLEDMSLEVMRKSFVRAMQNSIELLQASLESVATAIEKQDTKELRKKIAELNKMNQSLTKARNCSMFRSTKDCEKEFKDAFNLLFIHWQDNQVKSEL